MADWKEVISNVAPGLATAFGGPLAGAAVKVIADKVLGTPGASQEEVIQALSASSMTGEQIIALKAAEQQFQLELSKISADTEKAYLHDVQDSRARQIATKDTMPQTIFFLLLAVYVLEFGVFVSGIVPQDDFVRALLTRAFATVETGLTGAIAYFIGSSRGSKASGDAVRKIAESARG